MRLLKYLRPLCGRKLAVSKSDILKRLQNPSPSSIPSQPAPSSTPSSFFSIAFPNLLRKLFDFHDAFPAGDWRRRGYTRSIQRWIEVQKSGRIYELGWLSPFVLVFDGRVAPIGHRWNQHGLGDDNVKGSCQNLHPGPMSLLHWSGSGQAVGTATHPTNGS